MNKTEFIKAVSERKGITPRKAYGEVNDVMDTLRVILTSGDEVQLGGAGGSFCLGTFEVLTDLRGERIIAFNASKVLKQTININRE